MYVQAKVVPGVGLDAALTFQRCFHLIVQPPGRVTVVVRADADIAAVRFDVQHAKIGAFIRFLVVVDQPEITVTVGGKQQASFHADVVTGWIGLQNDVGKVNRSGGQRQRVVAGARF